MHLHYFCDQINIIMKKTSITLLLAVVCILSSLAQAQNPAKVFTIKGTVVDSLSNETVPFVTVSASKSTMPVMPFKRVAADAQGKFEFTVSTSEALILKFDAVGMKTTAISVSDFSNKTIELGKIRIAANDKMLSEVTVIAAKPLVKVDLDKITYDMKSDPESQTSSTLEMLRKVPMVTVDGDENIQVKGQSNFKIFMNGKETTMISSNPSQVLKSIPANTVKSIEVITEPGAKYEAEGLAGIINIITESSLKGYTGTVRAGVDNYGAVNGGLYFSTKVGKWGITTNLNQGLFRNPGVSVETKRESFYSPDFMYFNQKNEGKNTGNFRYGSLSVSYEMDSLNLFTLSGNGFGGGYNSKTTGSTNLLSQSMETVQQYNNLAEMKGIWGGYEGSIDYQRSFSKKGKLLTTSYKMSYSPRGSDNNVEVENVMNYFDNKQHIKSNSSGAEHTFQLDYTEPFNKKHVIEIGAKYIYRLNQSENDYQQYNFAKSAWEAMPGIVDKKMTHSNGILGAYGSYTYKLDKFSARAGGRLERTNASIQYNGDEAFTQKPFTNLVPSITLSYQTTPGSNLQLSYTQRISRPDITYLNPFRNISDPKNISQGNPDLIPEINNSFNLNYNLFTQKINFNSSIFTSFGNNSIEQVSMLRDTVVYSTYENTGRSRSTGISAYVRWQVTKDFNWYFNGNTRYSYFSFTQNNKLTENKGFNYGAFLGASYSLPKNFRVNTNGGYMSPSVSLQGKSNGFYYYSLSLTKSFLQRKLNISANANGFLQKFVSYKGSTETDTFRSENIITRKSPRFGINVSYTFGQMKEQIKKAARGIINDDVKTGGGENATQGTQTGTQTGN